MKLYSLIFSHFMIIEGGGRKVHIGRDNFATLCGKNKNLFRSVGGEINKEWINQPDPDGELCKDCKKKALKLLES